MFVFNIHLYESENFVYFNLTMIIKSTDTINKWKEDVHNELKEK